MSKKKDLQAVATIGAVTATGVIATTAHADTTPATSNAAVSQAPSADQQLSNLQASQAKAEQSLADQNQAALKSQTATIEQQASEAANKENKTYSDAVASQSAANQKELANAAQHIVTPAQKAQQESAAKSAYDKSKADLDAQHSAKNNQIKADYDAAAKKATDEAKANQTTAEQRHTQEVQDATQAVSDAQNKVNNLTQLNQQKQTELTNAKEQLDQANKKLVGSDYVPKVTVSGNTHGADFNISFTTDDINRVKADKRSIVFTSASTGKKYVWKFVPEYPDKPDVNLYHDRAAVVNDQGELTGEWLPEDYLPINDRANISDSEMQEITIWAANVLNQARAQVGSVPVHVSRESLAAAKDAMKQYAAKEEGFKHDYSIYSDVQNKYNLPNFASSIESPDIYGFTMGELKVNILNDFHNLITDTDGLSPEEKQEKTTFGHRYHLLGLDDPTGQYSWGGENNGTPYFALGSVNNAFHVFVSSDGYNQHELSLNDSTNNSAQALEQAQNAYDTASNAAKASAKELNDAKTDLANAQAKLATLQKSQGTSAADQALQAKLNDLAKTCDAAMQKENDSYNTAMNKLNADYQAKLDAIKKLPTNVDELKAQQQAKLDQMKKEHEAKLAQITNDAAAKIAAYKDQLDAKLNALKAKDVQTYQTLHNELFPQAQASVKSAINGSSSYMTASGQAVSFPIKGSNRSATSEASLPQTGNSSSVAVMALGLLGTMFGFGLMRKRG